MESREQRERRSVGSLHGLFEGLACGYAGVICLSYGFGNSDDLGDGR